MNQYEINIKKTTPRHIMAKLLKTKNKEEILKAAREGKKNWKQIIISETMEARRQWNNFFKVLKEKKKANPKFHIQQKLPLQLGIKERHLLKN